jgi:hypothetical protein
MMAHWDFNGNLLDSADKNAINATVYHASEAVTPVYPGGYNQDPNALNFDGTDQYLTVPGSPNAGFGNFRAGMTIAAYFKMDNSGNTNARLIEFANTDPNQTVYLAHRNDSDDELTFFTGGTRGEEGKEGLLLNRVFDRGDWSHVVVTMDKDGNVIGYKNGLPAAGATGTVAVPVQIARGNTRIGWDRADLIAKLNGRIGDLRIYNYPISAEDVKVLYAQVNGPFCVTNPDLDYVQTGASNCIVDLADFAYMAQRWLDCGLAPESKCP